MCLILLSPFYRPVLFSFAWFWAVKLLLCGRRGGLRLLVWLVHLGGVCLFVTAHCCCYLMASDMVDFFAAGQLLHYGSFREVVLFFAPLRCILFICTLIGRVSGFFFCIEWSIVCLLVPGTRWRHVQQHPCIMLFHLPPVAHKCHSIGVQFTCDLGLVAFVAAFGSVYLIFSWSSQDSFWLRNVLNVVCDVYVLLCCMLLILHFLFLSLSLFWLFPLRFLFPGVWESLHALQNPSLRDLVLNWSLQLLHLELPEQQMPIEDPFGNGEILPVLETKFRFFPPVQSMLPSTPVLVEHNSSSFCFGLCHLWNPVGT